MASRTVTEYELNFEQGATYKRQFEWKEKDITSTTISLEIMPKRNGTLITYDNGGNGGITITDAVAGEFELIVTATDTLAFDFNNGRYALFVEFTNGDKSKLLGGKADVEKKFF